jgi:cell cycle serine/threonine-protein kinase CDC5/MSD2
MITTKFPVELVEQNNQKLVKKTFHSFRKESYLREIACQNLSHPHLAKIIFGKEESDGSFTIYIEYYQNGDLLTFVERVINQNKFLSEDVIRTFFHQIFEAVEYMHSEGFAHLDIKLENIFLDKNYQVKLGDFDCATNQQDKVHHKGTKIYRAPETLIEEYEKFPADIYSLGIILFALKTGEFPCSESPKDSESGFELMGLMLMNRKEFWNR